MCEDTDNACAMCGTILDNNNGADKPDHDINIHFDNNPQQSYDTQGSTVEQDNNYATRQSDFSNQMPHNGEGNKIFNMLWVLVSFIPFINGFGIFYVGKKTSKKAWILEGIAYEIPVLFHLVSGPSFFTFSLVFLSIIVSVVRSMMIISKYRVLLNYGDYKKVDHRIISFLLFLSSMIPFLNGVALIYYGDRYSKAYMIVGVILEMIWVLVILLFNIIPLTYYSISMLVGVALASLVASGMIMISFNYDCDAFYHYAGNTQFNAIKSDKKYDKEMYDYYKGQLDDLKDTFDAKEEKVRKLIMEHFGSGNITSNRFLSVVDSSHENVYRQLNSGYDLINYTSAPSQQVEEELLERVTYINSINEEMEKLTVELILNMHEDDKSDENIKNLVNDMKDLINDVNKYE